MLVKLIPPTILNLEQALEFCATDECVEVTPENVRVRKAELDSHTRARARSRAQGRREPVAPRPVPAPGGGPPSADRDTAVVIARRPFRPAGRAAVVALLALTALLAGCWPTPAARSRPRRRPRCRPCRPRRPSSSPPWTTSVPVSTRTCGRDQSPVTQAISALVLPSVFRPDANGALQLDRTVATSAQVTSTAPFTVSYELNVQASWSSGAPIAAEDFVYLWQQMRSQPGTIGSSGYRAITDVRSRAGGKAVDVVFDRRLPVLAGAVLRPAARRTSSRTRPAAGPRRWRTASRSPAGRTG